MYRQYVADPGLGGAVVAGVLLRLRPRAAPRRAPPTATPRRHAGHAVGARGRPSARSRRPRRAARRRRRRSCSTARPPKPIRGAAARIVENMEASLGVPTATSVRNVPAKLLEVNRQILNNHLSRTGRGKVSFTHLIAYAAVQAVAPGPGDGLGLRRRRRRAGRRAPRSREPRARGRRREVRRLAHAARARTSRAPTRSTSPASSPTYEEMIRKVRVGEHHARRLRRHHRHDHQPGHDRHGALGARGSCPARASSSASARSATRPSTRAPTRRPSPGSAISKVITLTSTYDHRVIQGAESGEFLRAIHDLLLGAHDFYDDIFQSFGVPYEPARWTTDISPLDDEVAHNEKVVHVHQLINMYRVRGHLIANLDPLGRREPDTHPELDINHHGLSIWDLDREFPVGSLGAGTLGRKVMPLRDILGVVRDAYARTVGVEFMHIQDPEQKEWIQTRVEAPPAQPDAAVQRAHPRPPERRRGVRGVPRQEVPRARSASASRARSRSSRCSTRCSSAAADGGMTRGRARHRAPRPAQRAREHGRQELQPDLPRVRGRARPVVGAGLGRREVPRRRDRHPPRAVGRDDRRHARVEPEPPRGRRPGGRGHGPRQGRPHRRPRALRTCCRCSCTATPRSPARAWSPRR